VKKKTIFIIIAFVIIIGGVLAFLNQINISNYLTARNFLNGIIEGNFEKAFSFVDYYDVGDDLKPITSYEKAKDIWVSKMIKLKKDNIYLQEYKYLKVYMDNGYPEGEVILFISNNGRIEEQKCSIHFSKLTDKWKIEDLHIYNHSSHVFEKAVSGDVNVN
jgi:hypothetical protein